jgi:lipoprotein-releasing system ATP-binding protein
MLNPHFSPPNPVLRLDQVVKCYGETMVTEVLHGIDLSIYPGEFAALVGPSGSGKSTMLNVMGLLDRPSEGRVFIDETDTSTLDEGEITRLRGHALGFVFQFHHLLPAFTALENVMLPAYSLQGRVTRELRAKAERLLDRMGLGDRLHYPATHLSGGQQQRVAIARSLVMDPPILLADEPTGNLDTHAADQIFELLRLVRQERQMALLVVTHDPRLAQRSERIIELVDGRIMRDRSND